MAIHPLDIGNNTAVSRFAELFAEFIKEQSKPTEMYSAIMNLVERGVRHGYIYEDNNEIIGFAVVGLPIADYSINHTIQYFGITSAKRSNEHGSKFAKELIDKLKADGASVITVIVEANNPRASAFWSRVGMPVESIERDFHHVLRLQSTPSPDSV